MNVFFINRLVLTDELLRLRTFIGFYTILLQCKYFYSEFIFVLSFCIFVYYNRFMTECQHCKDNYSVHLKGDFNECHRSAKPDKGLRLRTRRV